MNVLKQMSDDEISFAIRYLDPDLNRGFGRFRRDLRHSKAKGKRWTASSFPLAAAGIALYILLLRWLPTLVRLMR